MSGSQSLMESGRDQHWSFQHPRKYSTIQTLDFTLVAWWATGLHFLCAAICWAIWKHRNEACFENKKLRNPAEILSYACALMTFWAGLYGMEMQGKIMDGVKLLLSCASKMMAQQHRSSPPLLMAPNQPPEADATKDSTDEDM